MVIFTLHLKWMAPVIFSLWPQNQKLNID